MTSGIRFCPKCGAEIPTLSAFGEGGCPGCLLETGLDPLVNEDGHPPDVTGVQHATRSERSVEMLGELGDYELLEEIGRGGQGVVFRARQKSLNRSVALKVIGLGQWATKAHLKRFRLEAEAAASLEHPCIVPIYEVGERGGACYFSMGLVEGGQLDEVAKREPMPIRHAAELIAKLARTVHYAHERGILHRDIKPGNILLDAKGEPHLTDFGLARLVETESTVTRTMEVLGTPSYMAPEQAVGNNAQVSSATDVYGLGAVLYQLLTGHPPFAGGTTYETIKLLLDNEPRQPRQLNPKIDRDLSTICLKCLEKDPKRRYSSALALAEDLECWLKHEPIRARRTGVFARGKKWVRRNPTTALFIALSLVLAAGSGWIAWKSELIRQPLTTGIAVLPFENLSPDSENAYFADGMQEEILTRLAGIADLKVISRTSTQQYQSKPKNLREIAKQLGVANILEGSVQKTADQARVNVQLINARTDSHLWAETYDHKVTDIFAVESEIAKRIAESLQAKLSSREEQALAVKPTNNPQAYDAYLRGRAFETRNRVSDFFSKDIVEKTAGFFEGAVELDPNFAIAWAWLARTDAYLYWQRADAVSTTRGDAAKHALENAQKLAPNAPETLLAQGYYQYRVLRDYGAAKTAFERVSRMLPSNSDVPDALGYVTRREGNWDESIAYFEQALTLDPRNVNILLAAAETYTMRRQWSAALKLYDRALDLMPNDPEVMAGKAGIYQAQGSLQEAARLLSAINWQTSSEGAFLIKITQLRLERDFGEAIRLLQARQVQFHFASEYDGGVNQVTLAMSQRLSGDMPGAKVTAHQACDIFERLGDQSDIFVPLVQSQAYAMMGEKGPALKVAEYAIMILPRARDAVDGPILEANLALIQTIFGENNRAISTLRDLLQTSYGSSNYSSTPITPALLRLDPIWDPLRSDPAFQKVCEGKQP
jgi:serine/threonine protein kinase/Tfp pilus assembly protein PilF